MALLPFKVFAVVEPVWQIAARVSIGEYANKLEFEGFFLTSQIALICLPALLLGALVQAAFCSRGQVWWTLAFLGFGFLFGPLGRTGLSETLATQVALGLNAIVMAIAVIAFQKLRWLELLCLAGGSLLGVPVHLVFKAVGPLGISSYSQKILLEFGPRLSLFSQALIALGMILLLRRAMHTNRAIASTASETPQ